MHEIVALAGRQNLSSHACLLIKNWRMRKQWIPGSLFPHPPQKRKKEAEFEARADYARMKSNLGAVTSVTYPCSVGGVIPAEIGYKRHIAV